MKKAKLRMVGLTGGLIAMLAASTAVAQEAEGQVGMGLPGAAPAPAGAPAGAVQAAGGSDHDLMVGHMAVGYLGTAGLVIGSPDAGEPGSGLVTAPVVGIRYWMDPGMGLDLGLGFALDGGSTEPGGGTSVDSPSHFAVILHGGVPLALANGRHYSFQIIPEMNLGIGSGSEVDLGSGDDVDHSGFGVDLGARAGAEVHFGFIGIPELSLQGSIGALLNIGSQKTTIKSDPEVEYKASSHSFRTTVYDTPWGIFTSNVAALYYF